MRKHKMKFAGIALFLVLTVGLVIFQFIRPASAEEISESGPELELIHINSDAEQELNSLATYVPSGDLKQGEGNYELTSNSYVVWLGNDDVSYAYKQFNVSDAKTDKLVMEATLPKVMTVDNGDLHANASVGLMFRSGLANNAAEVFLHAWPESVTVCYRSMTGGRTSYKQITLPMEYPIHFRMTKEGTNVKCEYKTASMSDYAVVDTGKITFTAPGPLYAGFAVNSIAESQFVTGYFKDLSFEGVGSYVPGASSDEEEDSDVVAPADEDIPMDNPNILLRETFTDNEIFDNKNAIGEYSWDLAEEERVKTEFGNRYLYRDELKNGSLYIGDENWTDYKASVDIQFTADCDLNPNNTNNYFRLFARSTRSPFYGMSDYAAVCQNVAAGSQIALYKRTLYSDGAMDVGRQVKAVTVPNFYGDGLWHNLAIRVFDDQISVYWDDECLITWEDDGSYCTKSSIEFIKYTNNKGRTGISTYSTFVKIDNLIVEKIEDPIGGDYDNYIGGNWDEPIPSYILDAVKKGIPYESVSLPDGN